MGSSYLILIMTYNLVHLHMYMLSLSFVQSRYSKDFISVTGQYMT